MNSENPPKGWGGTRLEEISDIILGQSPPSSTYNENRTGLPFYQGKLEFGSIYPTPTKWCSVPKKIAEKGDVLISVRAPVGPTNVCPEKSCIGRGLAAIRPLGGIETFFTLYLMRAFKNSIAGKGTGTTFDAITGIQLKEFNIPLPPLPEQRAIVSKIEQLFSDLDNGIENFKKAQAQLKLYRQSVLKAACEGKLVPTEAELARAEGREYEAADVLLARILEERRAKYKESVVRITRDLSAMPEGWCWATVEELNPANRTCAYGVLQPGDDVEIGVPLVRVGDIKEGRIVAIGMKKIVLQIAEEYTRTKLEGGEVLITLVGAIGRTAIVPKSLAGANTARAVGVIPLNNNIEAAWVNIFFQQAKKIAEMTSKSHEVARKTLNLEDVRATLIALPPLAEQRRIVAEVERRLSVSDKMEATITESLLKAESLRQSILKKAFEGKLLNKRELEKARNAPDWEPAEKLLERIRKEKARIGENKRKR